MNNNEQPVTGQTTAYPTEMTLADGTVINILADAGAKQFFDKVVGIASDVEKKKLYATITGQKSKLDALEQSNTNLTAQLKETMELYTQSAADRQKMLNEQAIREQNKRDDQQNWRQHQEDLRNIQNFNQQNPISVDAIVDSVTSRFATMLPDMIAQHLQGPVKDKLDKIEATNLENYKAGKIAALKEAKIGVIEEMIVGNNPAEIDASIEVAKTAYQKYYPQTAENTNAGNNQQTQQPAGSTNTVTQQEEKPVKLPYVGNHAQPEEVAMPNFAAMSNEDFAANRDAYMEQMRGFERQLQASKQQRRTA